MDRICAQEQKNDVSALFSEAEALNERLVSITVGSGEVPEEPIPFTDHHQEASATVIIVLVLLDMGGEIDDSPGQKGDLDLRRAGIAFVSAKLGDNFRSFGSQCRHIERILESAWPDPACRTWHRGFGALIAFFSYFISVDHVIRSADC